MILSIIYVATIIVIGVTAIAGAAIYIIDKKAGENKELD
jgi:preprotein translocase subunit SecE